MTITLTREEAQQVLDAMEAMQTYTRAERKGLRIFDEAIETLRARLAQPEPKPVAWMLTELDGTPLIDCGDLVVKQRPVLVSDKTDCIPLYTAPSQRERVVFPTFLRKMWSGSEVQAWLDENLNKEKNT
jgi:hypothetical protein